MPRRFEDRHFIAVFVLIAALFVAPFAYDRVTSPPESYDPVRAAEIRQVRAAEDAAEEATTLHIAVIGDSYTGGSEMGGTGAASWLAVADTTLRGQGFITELTSTAVGGTGYLATGDGEDVDVDVDVETFGDRVSAAVRPETELVIVFGSRNDPGRGDVEPAAADVYRQAREIAPDAELLVIGVPWIQGRNAPPEYLVTRDQLVRAADDAGATFLDPIGDDWFGGDAAALIGEDGIHPTDAGHAYMAERITAGIAELVDAAQAR